MRFKVIGKAKPGPAPRNSQRARTQGTHSSVIPEFALTEAA